MRNNLKSSAFIAGYAHLTTKFVTVKVNCNPASCGWVTLFYETFAKRHFSKSARICPIYVSGSNFNPRNTPCIPVVKIFAFLELEQISEDFEN
jgi:hypothetical protein